MGDIVYNTPHLLSKILYYFGGLITPSAIAINSSINKTEITFNFDKFIYFFYKDYSATDYIIINNDFTFMYIALSTKPPDRLEWLESPLKYGTFFRKNILSYREVDLGSEYLITYLLD